MFERRGYDKENFSNCILTYINYFIYFFIYLFYSLCERTIILQTFIS